MAAKKAAKKPAANAPAKAAGAAARGVQRFVVDLGGLPVSEEAARQLETDIRKAALSVVAGIDFRGDLRLSPGLEALGPTRGIRIALAKTPLNQLKG